MGRRCQIKYGKAKCCWFSKHFVATCGEIEGKGLYWRIEFFLLGFSLQLEIHQAKRKKKAICHPTQNNGRVPLGVFCSNCKCPLIINFCMPEGIYYAIFMGFFCTFTFMSYFYAKGLQVSWLCSRHFNAKFWYVPAMPNAYTPGRYQNNHFLIDIC
jgi:hypothetical protein